MPQTRTIPMPFPVRGVVRATGYDDQPALSSPDAKNVWGYDWTKGRERGGTRPGLASIGASLGGYVPYSWSEVAWVDTSVTKEGVAIATSGGVYVLTSASSATRQITSTSSTDFCTAAGYLDYLYFARNGSSLIRLAFTAGAAGGSTITPSAGTVPTKCGIVLAHLDRLWLMGDQDHPSVYYASRVGDPEDWDYAETDSGAAFAGSGSDGGIVGGAIVAGISHTHDCLLIGCRDGLYRIVGNPRSGGIAERLSAHVGPLMQSAWNHDAAGRLWMMTRDGLYMVPPGCGEPPYTVSRRIMPNDLVGIDPGSSDHVSVCYDLKWRGVHIYVDYNSGTDQHWFYQFDESNPLDGSFWPMDFPSTLRLGVALKPAMTTAKSALLAYTAGGSGYQFDNSQTTDGGTGIDSYVVYPPIQVGRGGRYGQIVEIVGVPAENSGDVQCKLWGRGSTHEAYSALSGTADYACDVWATPGLNYRDHPRLSCTTAYAKMEDVSSSRWGMEEAYCIVQHAGPRRVT